MTMLQRLRDEQANYPPGSELQKLLCWAELHIADQFDRIDELESDLKRVESELEQRITALKQIQLLLSATGDYILTENFSAPVDSFAKDYAPWRNILAINGFNQNGEPAKNANRKRHDGLQNIQGRHTRSHPMRVLHHAIPCASLRRDYLQRRSLHLSRGIGLIGAQ